MRSAAVVSLEEFRQARVRAEARRQLHERFDRWLDAVEERVPEKTPALEQVTQAVFAMRHELTGMITEALVEEGYGQALQRQTTPCPHCGRLLRARGSPNRTVETMVGAVSLTRPYFYCVRCQKGFYPLDEALQLSEHRKQWDMQKAAASLATEVSYEAASDLFGQLTGLSFSDHIAHEVVGELTEDLTVLSVSPTAEEIVQRVAQVAEGKNWLSVNPTSGTVPISMSVSVDVTDLAADIYTGTITVTATISGTQNSPQEVTAELCNLLGDLNCDCVVNVADIMQVANKWRCRRGEDCYDERYDLDKDGDIDIVDIMLVVKHWGETCP